MILYIARRIGHGFLLLFGVSILLFLYLCYALFRGENL